MSPDTFTPNPEYSREWLQKTFSEIVYLPTKEDAAKLHPMAFIDANPNTQTNLFEVSLVSPNHGILSMPIPGIFGDTENTFPDILRSQGIPQILTYRASHEGLLKIDYPPLRYLEDIAQLQSIDIYSRSHFNDLHPAPYKRVTFREDKGPVSLRQVKRQVHYFSTLKINNGNLGIYGHGVNGFALSAEEAQIEEFHFMAGNEPFTLRFGPQVIPYRAENAYSLLKDSPPHFIYEN